MLFRNAKVPAALIAFDGGARTEVADPLEPTLLCDVRVSEDRIESVLPAAPGLPPREPSLDLGGSLLFPGLVDCHVHLDKAHTWERAPNRRGTFADAVAALDADQRHWTEEDLHRRASFSLRTAWAHGTVALRTHLDSPPPIRRRSHAVLAQLKREWAGRLVLQTVPLVDLRDYAGREGEELADLAAEQGAVALGGLPAMHAELPDQLDRVMALAAERGLGLDLHLDESGDPTAETLRATAEAVLRNRFPHPVVGGHACSLAQQTDARAQETLALVKAAGIGLIALPLCNLFLQDRRFAAWDSALPLTPRWRGITLLHEALARGIPLACASDNVRDAFHAYGDFDLLEVFLASVRLAHLDTRLAAAPRLVTSAAAGLMGLPRGFGRLEAGAPARAVRFAATTFGDLLSRPATRRELLVGETLRPSEPPAYDELRR